MQQQMRIHLRGLLRGRTAGTQNGRREVLERPPPTIGAWSHRENSPKLGMPRPSYAL